MTEKEFTREIFLVLAVAFTMGFLAGMSACAKPSINWVTADPDMPWPLSRGIWECAHPTKQTITFNTEDEPTERVVDKDWARLPLDRRMHSPFGGGHYAFRVRDQRTGKVVIMDQSYRCEVR